MFAAVDEGFYIAVIAYAVTVVPPRKRVILALRLIFELVKHPYLALIKDRIDLVRDDVLPRGVNGKHRQNEQYRAPCDLWHIQALYAKIQNISET